MLQRMRDANGDGRHLKLSDVTRIAVERLSCETCLPWFCVRFRLFNPLEAEMLDGETGRHYISYLLCTFQRLQ